MGRLMLDGIATQILSEMIETLCLQNGESSSGLARWERLALAEIVEHIFRDALGRSPADFTRAYRAHFGETPARTLRRSLYIRADFEPRLIEMRVYAAASYTFR